jgi:phosphoribosylglycinamide formyltransferase-1
VSGVAGPQSIVVLISGRGSNMRTLVEESRLPDAPYRVALVLSDKPAAAGLAVARDLGIATQAIAAVEAEPSAVRSVPPDLAIATSARESYDERLATAIDAYAPPLIVLAGFMRILSAKFVERYAGRLLNIHPSLLPKYPGLHTHRKALAARDAEHGATVHFVTAELDGGPPVIQARVPVEPSDDEATLAARVQAVEHRIYPLAVRWFCEGRLRCKGPHAWLDGRRLETPVMYEDAKLARGR